MLTWQERMVRRLTGQEPGIPWFLHDKMKCYQFCDDRGFATALVLRQFDSPSSFDLSGLPDEFVVKPTGLHSTRGVLVLKREGELFRDQLRGREMSLKQVVSEQTLYFEQTDLSFNKIIVEQKIVDHEEGFAVPRDFKAYAFHGKISLILEINRNTKPSTVAWFDGEFAPVKDGRVTTNPKLAQERSATRPRDWEAIVEFAQRVSAAIPTPFASIDMYATTRGPIVGEITLAPGGLYYGKQFTLSSNQQKLMGLMWDSAAERLLASGR